MKLTRMRVDVYQVRPLSPENQVALADGSLVLEDVSRANWERIKRGGLSWGATSTRAEPEPELEPSENEEFGVDFILSSSLETVRVYVYLANAAKRRARKELGWTVTNYYDLVGERGAESAVNVVAVKAAAGVAVKEERS